MDGEINSFSDKQKLREFRTTKPSLQQMFKGLKEKNIQPRLLYPARISFKIDGEIKSFFRQAKVNRIQYDQTSFTTNVKGTYIVKKYSRRKRSTKSTPNN